MFHSFYTNKKFTIEKKKILHEESCTQNLITNISGLSSQTFHIIKKINVLYLKKCQSERFNLQNRLSRKLNSLKVRDLLFFLYIQLFMK